MVHVSSSSSQNPLHNGAGTGFIWDNAGHVVTNHHVIKNSSKLTIRLNTTAKSDTNTWGKVEKNVEVEAEVVGKDIPKDIAVLRIKEEDRKDLGEKEWRPLERGRSRDLKVGQRVFAIGSPFGLERTLTMGIVSGVGRELGGGGRVGRGQPLFGIIQTDAAISKYCSLVYLDQEGFFSKG